LHDEHLAVGPQGVAEPLAVGERPVIHENHDVLADLPLVVEQIPPQLGLPPKHVPQRRRHSRPVDVHRFTRQMPAEMGSE